MSTGADHSKTTAAGDDDNTITTEVDASADASVDATKGAAEISGTDAATAAATSTEDAASGDDAETKNNTDS